MNNKILLISPNFEDVSLFNASKFRPKGIKTSPSSHYPLGFAYLHSFLEMNGYNINVLFLNNYEYDFCQSELLKAMEEFKPDTVSFQIFTANRYSAYRLIEKIHTLYPYVKIVIGGIHATIMHDQIIRKYPYVIAILGEGELTFLELMNEMNKKEPVLEAIKGIAFHDGNKVVKNPDRPLIEDLDTLPFPKHEVYFADTPERTTGCLFTSRGCPFGCSFCCLDSISRRRVRMRSAKNVVDEIEMLATKLPQIKKIWIEDDNFFIDNNRVIEICGEIIKRNIKLDFICSARVKPITKEMIDKLVLAGFKKVLMGLESANETILKSCHKNITQNDVIDAVKLFSATDIKIAIFLIVGLPGENWQTVKETTRFVKKIQKMKYVPFNEVSILTVYPGTEVYNIAKAGNIIDDDYWLTDKPTPLFTLENSQKRLFQYKNYMLNRISLDNFLTPAGFIGQIDMFPVLFNYWKNNKSILISMISRSLKIFFPDKLFNFFKKVYHKLKK